MGHNAQQCINGEVRAFFQPDQSGGKQQRDGNHRIKWVNVEQQTESDTQQRGVGEGIAEIGHAAPDHK